MSIASSLIIPFGVATIIAGVVLVFALEGGMPGWILLIVCVAIGILIIINAENIAMFIQPIIEVLGWILIILVGITGAFLF